MGGWGWGLEFPLGQIESSGDGWWGRVEVHSIKGGLNAPEIERLMWLRWEFYVTSILPQLEKGRKEGKEGEGKKTHIAKELF